MDKYMWFYFGVMAVLVVVNALQIGRKVGRVFPNILQIVVYLFAMGWFILMIGKGLDLSFFFWTGLAFVLCFAVEVWQVARLNSREYKKISLAIGFLLFSALPILCSFAILSGLI